MSNSKNKILLDIVALSHSVTQNHNYAVVLAEKDGSRRLPIVIGAFEAQAIAVAMENMQSARPLTHDLFKNTLESFGIEVKEVIINNLDEGVFYASLLCIQNGVITEIDSRTSDALAMAVRFDCPIYSYEWILESAGVVLEDEESTSTARKAKQKNKPSKGRMLSSLSIEDLNARLTKVLAQEDYEQAAKIRDELNKRSQQG